MNFIDKLELVAEEVRSDFDAKTAVRDTALSDARMLIRYCSQAIRAVHREEYDKASADLAEAAKLAEALNANKIAYPSIFFSGYTQDALKEYAEAKVVFALVQHAELPTRKELALEGATYFKGLSEVVGELRRRILDLMRSGHSPEVETLLQYMDDIYAILVTIDYSDAITHGLRRQTDIARSIIERTRGDMAMSYRQQRLEETLREVEARINPNE